MTPSAQNARHARNLELRLGRKSCTFVQIFLVRFVSNISVGKLEKFHKIGWTEDYFGFFLFAICGKSWGGTLRFCRRIVNWYVVDIRQSWLPLAAPVSPAGDLMESPADSRRRRKNILTFSVCLAFISCQSGEEKWNRRFTELNQLSTPLQYASNSNPSNYKLSWDCKCRIAAEMKI